MGLFDTVAGQQVKLVDGSYDCYKVGDAVPYADGCYITYEGSFIVSRGKVVGAARKLYSKWGGEIQPGDILDPGNPIAIAIRPYMRRRKKSDVRR